MATTNSARDTLKAVLMNWGAAQVARLKRAFSLGGHAFHGGKQWPLNKDPQDPMPLSDSGKLRDSTYSTVQGQTVTIGNRDPIAVFHQNGTRTIPQREVVVVTTQDLESLKAELKLKLEQALQRM